MGNWDPHGGLCQSEEGECVQTHNKNDTMWELPGEGTCRREGWRGSERKEGEIHQRLITGLCQKDKCMDRRVQDDGRWFISNY